MMSKERELLMRWLRGEANEMTTHIPLLIETQNLLAQPEQTEHWKETLIEHFQTAFDSEMYQTDEGEELILLEDAICYVEEFTPPKREPIEEGELEVWYSQHTWAMDKQEYMWGFRDAEKAYGITGGE